MRTAEDGLGVAGRDHKKALATMRRIFLDGTRRMPLSWQIRVKDRARFRGLYRPCRSGVVNTSPVSAQQRPEVRPVGVLGLRGGPRARSWQGRSADEAHAQRGDGQALQDGSGHDDAVPVALQCAGVGWCLVFVGGGGECAVDRRADAQVEQHPGHQQCERCSCGG